jgi:hypothetical protein
VIDSVTVPCADGIGTDRALTITRTGVDEITLTVPPGETARFNRRTLGGLRDALTDLAAELP